MSAVVISMRRVCGPATGANRLERLTVLPESLTVDSVSRLLRLARLRADLDYKFNLKSELEMGQLLSTVEKISERLQALAPLGEPSRPSNDRGASAAPRRPPR